MTHPTTALHRLAIVFACVSVPVHATAQQTAVAGAQSLPPVPDTAFANRIAGCYVLVAGEWQTGHLLDHVRPAPQGRIAFELLTGLDTSRHADGLLHQVRSDSIAGYPHGLFSTWTRISGAPDRIRIGQPFPFADFSLRVTPQGEGLVGEFVAFAPGSADIVSTAVAPATAKRVECGTG
jgi:hypothetical protein